MAENLSSEGFGTDFDKEYFTIEITACQGGSKYRVMAKDGHQPTFHEVLGTLEYYKYILMTNQVEHNKPIAAAHMAGWEEAKGIDARETSPSRMDP